MSRNPATGAMTAGAAQLNPASPDTPGLTSSRGRLVKPKVWDDGTEAVPAVGKHPAAFWTVDVPHFWHYIAVGLVLVTDLRRNSCSAPRQFCD
jgi:hypothetical protein